MINKKEVQHIAKLARLGLAPAEIKKFQKELSSILDYIEKLKEVDVSKVKPMSHSLPFIENVIRGDEAKTQSPKRVNKLIEAAPKKEKKYIRTKAIL